MSKYKNAGIVIADIDEYKPFFESIKHCAPKSISLLGKSGHVFALPGNNGSMQVTALLCGIGKVNAAVAAAALISSGCDLILNIGLSGGISGVFKGEKVLGKSFFEHDFDLTCLGYALCEKPGQEYIYNADGHLSQLFTSVLPGIKSGVFASGDCFVSNETLRCRLRDSFSAVACDMETAAIASVCFENQIPFASLRQISDDAGSNAASSYREMNKNQDVSMAQIVLEVLNLIVKE